MATLRWDIWEQNPIISRKDIASDEWEKEISARVAAYPKLDFAYEQRCIRKNIGTTDPAEAFAHLNTLILSKQNTQAEQQVYRRGWS